MATIKVITFDAGKEPETKKALLGTVISVNAGLTYSKSLISSDGSTVLIESKPESISLGNMMGFPNPGTEQTEQQKAISDAEDVAKQEIVAALIKYDAVRKANTVVTQTQ